MIKDKKLKREVVVRDFDITMARFQAREIAREMGFGAIDQARISLAVGELARVLARHLGGDSQILISGTQAEGQFSIQVIGLESDLTNSPEQAIQPERHHDEPCPLLSPVASP